MMRLFANHLICALGIAMAAACAPAQEAKLAIPPSGVIGLEEQMLSADYWIARAPEARNVLMTAAQIAAVNGKTISQDSALVDVAKLGPATSLEQVLKWLQEAAEPPTKPLVNVNRKGETVPQSAIDAVVANVGKDHIPEKVAIRYGLSVRRAQLRAFPTELQAFPSRDLLDFESFQGGTLFPGDPVAIVHTSADGLWYFIVSWQGPAWVLKESIAEGPAELVFSYAGGKSARVVTGDQVRTVFTPEAPEVSQLELDMGTRIPLANLPPDQPVNGQGPYESWTLTLPVRGADGSLSFRPALLRRTTDTTGDYLPLTRENIIRQAFKFLGERYGWGHLYNARDCSGFTSDVYRSMGLILPPNSGAQGKSPAFSHQLFSASDSHETRLKAVMEAQVGDLIVVPGHVLMILGKVHGQPYVIQDVPFAVFHDPTGKIHRTKLNEVSVTPLLPLLADENHSYVDVMTSLVHVTEHK
jgi:hypothetical protein